MSMACRSRFAWLWVVAVLIAGSWAFAQDAAAPAIDPKADEIIRNMSQYFSKLNSVSLDLTQSVHVEAQGQKQDISSSWSIAVRRPNLFAMVLKSGIMGGTVVSDGKQIYAYLPMMKAYTVSDAPATLEELSGNQDVEMLTGRVFFAGSLMLEDPYKDIMDGVTAGKYIGEEEIKEKKYHRMKFNQEDMDWEIWVETGDAPLPLKVAPDMSKVIAQTAARMPDGQAPKIEMVITFANWKVNTELPEQTFSFTPPDDAKKVSSFFEALGEDEEEASPLLGKPAPDFTLPLLDGGKVQLAQHKDKDIVVLDFWATWCGPCIRALPALVKLTDEYKGKGVVFYAVNQGEDADTINGFLKKQKITCKVALDSETEVGELYGVSGIPQTVMIGKDGTVQVVHVGFMFGMEKELKEQLDALLAGKNLAAEAAGEEE